MTRVLRYFPVPTRLNGRVLRASQELFPKTIHIGVPTT